MNNLAKKGIDAYLVEMPLNLAFLGSDSADEIIKNSNYSVQQNKTVTDIIKFVNQFI